jgi:hypothetical protein
MKSATGAPDLRRQLTFNVRRCASFCTPSLARLSIVVQAHGLSFAVESCIGEIEAEEDTVRGTVDVSETSVGFEVPMT